MNWEVRLQILTEEQPKNIYQDIVPCMQPYGQCLENTKQLRSNKALFGNSSKS